MQYLLGLFAAFVLAVFGWNTMLGFGAREAVPIMAMTERLVPFIAIENASVYEVPDRYNDDNHAKFSYTVTNNSAYPITNLEVDCDMNWAASGAEWDSHDILEGEVLMPTESREFLVGHAGIATYQDTLENLHCEVVEAETPFSRWDGMPVEFSNLDWQRGSAAIIERRKGG